MTIGAPMSPDSPSFPSWLTMELIYRVAMDGERVSVRFIRTALRQRRLRTASSFSFAIPVDSGVALNMSSCSTKD